jgi:excisionase family DNA binding protein
MANIKKFGKVTHDNLPQAVEHLLEIVAVQVEEKQNQLMQTSDDDDMDIDQASKLLKKSKSTIYRYTCNNTIPYYKIGKSLRFRKSELLEWIKDQVRKTEKEILTEITTPFDFREANA